MQISRKDLYRIIMEEYIKEESETPDDDFQLEDIKTMIKELLYEVRTVASKWWKYDPEEVMRDIYWGRNQIPPSDKEERARAWEDLKAQLEEKYPRPSETK